MLATLFPATPARWIAPLIVATERDLIARYLSDDLDEVCAAAAAAGDPVFLAMATLPLASRREAIDRWRKKKVCELMATSEPVRDFLAQAAPDLAESIREGQVSLSEIDHSISAFREDAEQRQRELVLASKTAMAKAVRSVLRDCSEADEGTISPQYLAILANGEFGLFRRREGCLQFARASGIRFMLCELDGSKTRIYPGPETD